MKLEKASKMLNNYILDVSALAGISPFQVIDFFDTFFKEYYFKKSDSTSDIDGDFTSSDNDIGAKYIKKTVRETKADVIFNKLHDLKKKASLSQKFATLKTEYYQTLHENILNFFKPKNFFQRQFFSTNLETEKFIFPFLNTWTSIKKELPQLASEINFKYIEHNNLAKLLFLNDIEFIDNFRSFNLVLIGEIGLLMLARLWDLAHSSETPLSIQRKAKQAMYSATGQANIFNLLQCNFEALDNEITKLYLHAALNPKKLTIWIGTARAVNAKALNQAGEGIYFNPTPRFSSWMLNRFWLQTAIELGYEVNLIEQHFPSIEKAILAASPTLLLTQLAYEMRPSLLTSQYNGDDGPTATSQEILASLHLDYIGKRKSDYSISIGKKSAKTMDDSYELTRHQKLLNRHSCPDILNQAAPLPPLSSRLSHFQPPKKEEEFCRSDLEFLIKKSIGTSPPLG